MAASSPTRQGSVPSSPSPRQRRMKALSSHSAPIVVGSVCPGWTLGLGRKLHQHLHDRALKVVEGRRTWSTHAADRPLEQRVAGEHRFVADPVGDHAVGVTGGVQGVDAQVADPEQLAGLDRAVDVDQALGLERVGQDLHPEPLLVDMVLGHVVAVVVGQEKVRRPHVVALDLSQKLLGGPARVDDQRVAARTVGDEVGVREPVGVHRALDDHAEHLTPGLRSPP